jgi:hypothetical protein
VYREIEEPDMTKKNWERPTIESESAFETLVLGCDQVDEAQSIECGFNPLTS